MSRKGDYYENEPAESFHATIKKELVYSERFKTRADAMDNVFEYFEVFYNRQRLYSSLGYHAPQEYWQKFARSKYIG